MTRHLKRSVVLGVLALALLLPLVFSASAAAYPGWGATSEKQVGPGTTVKTIYGKAQVYMYKLPHNVTHRGYIHVDLNYYWADYDCYIYLIGANGDVVATSDGNSTEPQGYASTWGGHEAIDFYVQSVANTAVNPANDDLVGDEYYVMVQAWADVSYFRISGYYPRIDFDPDVINNPAGGYNWYRGTFGYPKSKDSRTRIYGVPYGLGDFTPTSVGKAVMQMRYPWNAGTKQPEADYLDTTKRLCAFDQYLYPSDWGEDGAIWDMAYGSGSQHWAGKNPMTFADTADGHITPPNDDWRRGIEYKFLIEKEQGRAPNKVLHWIPCLWEVAADPSLGFGSAPATGMSTIGYRGSLTYPQNLYLNKSSVKLRSGKVSLKGNLAYNPIWINPADPDGIVWAPDGDKVTIQAKKGSGSWKKVGTGTVAGGSGAWTAKVKAVKGTAKYRAFWQGTQLESITIKTRDQWIPGVGGAWTSANFYTTMLPSPLYPDGEYDISVNALDMATGATMGTGSETIANPTPPPDTIPWPGATMKAGDPVQTFTFTGKEPVQVQVVSHNVFSENSLSKTVVN